MNNISQSVSQARMTSNVRCRRSRCPIVLVVRVSAFQDDYGPLHRMAFTMGIASSQSLGLKSNGVPDQTDLEYYSVWVLKPSNNRTHLILSFGFWSRSIQIIFIQFGLSSQRIIDWSDSRRVDRVLCRCIHHMISTCRLAQCIYRSKPQWMILNVVTNLYLYIEPTFFSSKDGMA